MTLIVAASLSSFEQICSGSAARVMMSDVIKSEYFAAIEGNDDISRRRRTHMHRYMLEFCSIDPHRLSEEKFKREGKFPDGNGHEAVVFTFKAWQMRVYGTITDVDGLKTFIAVRLDLLKKQDKADRSKLLAAAQDIGNIRKQSARILKAHGK